MPDGTGYREGEVGGFYDLKAAVEKCRELAQEWVPAAAEKPDLLAMYEGRRQEQALILPVDVIWIKPPGHKISPYFYPLNTVKRHR